MIVEFVIEQRHKTLASVYMPWVDKFEKHLVSRSVNAFRAGALLRKKSLIERAEFISSSDSSRIRDAVAEFADKHGGVFAYCTPDSGAIEEDEWPFVYKAMIPVESDVMIPGSTASLNVELVVYNAVDVDENVLCARLSVTNASWNEVLVMLDMNGFYVKNDVIFRKEDDSVVDTVCWLDVFRLAGMEVPK